ncbi:STAS domain-containing protein [Planctomycetota bacterium]
MSKNPAREAPYKIGGEVMGIQNFSEDVLLITLPEQPQHGEEIDIVNKLLSDSVDFDVLVDFSKVEMLTSGSICGLMILDKLLRGSGHKLVLFNLPSAIKQIFVRTGLITVFDLADDEFDAQQHIQDKSSSMAEF